MKLMRKINLISTSKKERGINLYHDDIRHYIIIK